MRNSPTHLQRRRIWLHGQAAPQALAVLQSAGDDQPANLATGSPAG